MLLLFTPREWTCCLCLHRENGHVAFVHTERMDMLPLFTPREWTCCFCSHRENGHVAFVYTERMDMLLLFTPREWTCCLCLHRENGHVAFVYTERMDMLPLFTPREWTCCLCLHRENGQLRVCSSPGYRAAHILRTCIAFAVLKSPVGTEIQIIQVWCSTYVPYCIYNRNSNNPSLVFHLCPLLYLQQKFK